MKRLLEIERMVFLKLISILDLLLQAFWHESPQIIATFWLERMSFLSLSKEQPHRVHYSRTLWVLLLVKEYTTYIHRVSLYANDDNLGKEVNGCEVLRKIKTFGHLRQATILKARENHRKWCNLSLLILKSLVESSVVDARKNLGQFCHFKRTLIFF